MSLIDFVAFASDLIDEAFDKPNFPFRSKASPIAPPITKNYGTVGTAFDYAMRLQLLSLNSDLIRDFPLVAAKGCMDDAKRERFLAKFERRKGSFLKGELQVVALIPDCIVLAKMESVFRSGRDFSNSDIFHVDDGDVHDLEHLLGLIDSRLFTAKTQCVLNPGFGQSSVDVGGADADFILDDTLIDIKTAKELKLERSHFRQLLGYYVLNRRENNRHGRLKKLGVYFARFGKLFTFPIPEPRGIKDRLTGETRTFWEAIELKIRNYGMIQVLYEADEESPGKLDALLAEYERPPRSLNDLRVAYEQSPETLRALIAAFKMPHTTSKKQ